MPHTFAVGDLVKHKRAFLRSAGWYTNVPKNGTVISIERFGECTLLRVKWNNYVPTGNILDANVVPANYREAE